LLLEEVMPANQPMPDRNWQDEYAHARRTPRCYARAATSDDIDQARADTQCTAVLMLLSVLTCAAVFAVAYGGWGF
jgi:hypothetical protein